MSMVKTKGAQHENLGILDKVLDSDILKRSEFSNLNHSFPGLGFFVHRPFINIKETENNFQIEIAAPGLSKDEFLIKAEDHSITVSTKNKEAEEENKEKFLKKEFSFEKFNRTFQIPKNTVIEKIEAKYEEGLIKLIIPKLKETISQAAVEIKVL